MAWPIVFSLVMLLRIFDDTKGLDRLKYNRRKLKPTPQKIYSY